MTGLRRLLVAAAASQVGDWLCAVALVTLVYAATGSAYWLAALTIARLGPYLILEPLAGVLVDRVEPKMLLVGSDVVRATLMVVLAVVIWRNGPTWPVLLIVGLSTCASAPYPPALAALVPRLVGEDRLVAANATLSTIENVAIVLGPSLGALLLLIGPPELAVLVNAATFAVAAVAVAGVPPVRRPSGRLATAENWHAELRRGWAVLADSPLAITVVGFAVLDHLLYGADTVLLLLVSARLDSAAGVGYLFAGAGLGGVAVAVFGRRLVVTPRAGTVLGLATAACAIPTALLLVGNSLTVAVGWQVVHGAGFVLTELVAVTTLQRTLPADALGRVFGLYGAAVVGGILVGTAAAPVVVRAAGLSGALIVFGLVPGALALAAVRALRPIDAVARAGFEHLAARLTMLARLDLFVAATQPSLERLAAAAVAERVPADTTILRQGDPATDFYLLTEGSTTVAATTDGVEREIARMQAGDHFGEIGVLSDGVRTATVRTFTDCAVLRISADDFREALTAGGGASPVLVATMTSRVARSRSPSVATKDGR